MQKEQIKVLLEKLDAGVATKEEIALLETWYLNYNKEIPSDLPAAIIEEDVQAVYARLPRVNRIFWMWPRIAVAASVFLILSIGAYVFERDNSTPYLNQQNKLHDIAAGSNKAVLTLANGKQILLSDEENGRLAQQGNSVVNKTSGGRLVYIDTNSAGSDSSKILYNNLSTPRGGQFQLTLSDGTRVWLNAASSIKYPTVFTGKERRVEVTGEAYFEVVYNKAKPFIVVTNKQTITDLGTQFDINSYGDEPEVKTTLVEGSVKIATSRDSVILKPGEQAQNRAGSRIGISQQADIEEIVAWKKGLFQFKNASIESIMRQASRWYNVSISYSDNKIPSKTFTGNISRNSNASQLLEILSYTGVKFKIAGSKIIVITE